MSRLRWENNKVISLKLKDNSFVLGQLLRKPYIAFFHGFDEEDKWNNNILHNREILFISAVTNQFLKFSEISIQNNIQPKKNIAFPKYWIKNGPTFRKVKITIDSVVSIEFSSIGIPTENTLIELDEVSGQERIVQNTIDPTDDSLIEKYELHLINIFPNLNERLYLCKMHKKNIDVDKDVLFDRPIKADFLNYIKILASEGSLTDWGYSSP